MHIQGQWQAGQRHAEEGLREKLKEGCADGCCDDCLCSHWQSVYNWLNSLHCLAWCAVAVPHSWQQQQALRPYGGYRQLLDRSSKMTRTCLTASAKAADFCSCSSTMQTTAAAAVRELSHTSQATKTGSNTAVWQRTTRPLSVSHTGADVCMAHKKAALLYS